MNLESDEQKNRTPVERILELARWAPSGDNTQCWRFELVDANHFNVHARDTRDWCVYDLDGRASQIAIGALLETIVIASTGEGMRAEITRRPDTTESAPVIEITLVPDQDLKPSPLIPFIESRTTQRRSMSTESLTAEQRRPLEESVGSGYSVRWIEGWKRKQRMAKLLYKNAGIRLTIPEAYEVHRRVIEWDARYSNDRIPDQAVGLDRGSLRLMRWAMHSWDRVRVLNRYFAGTILPRVQLDLIPALRCGAHFAIIAEAPGAIIDDYFDGGRAVQRFWLTSARLGLQFQPELTPLIFASYVRNATSFTVDRRASRNAISLEAELVDLLGRDVATNAVFMGRVGRGKSPFARSLRKPVRDLLVQQQ